MSDTPSPSIISTDTWGSLIKICLILWPLGRYRLLSNTVTNLPINSFSVPKQLQDQVCVTMVKAHYWSESCFSRNIHILLCFHDQSAFLASYPRILVISLLQRGSLQIPSKHKKWMIWKIKLQSLEQWHSLREEKRPSWCNVLENVCTHSYFKQMN